MSFPKWSQLKRDIENDRKKRKEYLERVVHYTLEYAGIKIDRRDITGAIFTTTDLDNLVVRLLDNIKQ